MPRKKRNAASGPVFTYRAHDDSGRVISGTTDALCRDDIVRKLKARGYTVEVLEGEQRASEECISDETAEPLTRIVTVILEQARTQEARSIRACLPRRARATSVSYLISDAWQEVMGLPSNIWPLLRARLAGMAGVKLSYGVCREPGSIWHETHGQVIEYRATFRRNQVLLERQREMPRLSDPAAPVPHTP